MTTTYESLSQFIDEAEELETLDGNNGKKVLRFLQQHFPEGRKEMVFTVLAGDYLDLALFGEEVSRFVGLANNAIEMLEEQYPNQVIPFAMEYVSLNQYDRTATVHISLKGEVPERMKARQQLLGRIAFAARRLLVMLSVIGAERLVTARAQLNEELDGELEALLPKFNALVESQYAGIQQMPVMLVEMASSINPFVHAALYDNLLESAA